MKPSEHSLRSSNVGLCFFLVFTDTLITHVLWEKMFAPWHMFSIHVDYRCVSFIKLLVAIGTPVRTYIPFTRLTHPPVPTFLRVAVLEVVR